MKQINVVYATDHNYIFLLLTSMYSLLDTMDSECQIHIHLQLDETITDEDRKLIKNVANKYDYCTVHEFYIDDDCNDVNFSESYLSKATLYRLMLPSILPNLDKCIYLDCDTLVRGNVSELYDIDIDNYYVGAVKDIGIYHLRELVEGYIDNLESYINAGVMLMNLKKIREDSMQDVFWELLKNKYTFFDQDILNISCYGKIKFIDEKWNHFSYIREGFENANIIHFLSHKGMRPWINRKALGADEWWSYAVNFKDSECYQKQLEVLEQFEEETSFERMIRKCKTYENVYIWGAGAEGISLAWDLRKDNIKVKGIIDANTALHGLEISGFEICSKENILDLENAYFIIANTRWAKEIYGEAMDIGIAPANVHIFKERPGGYYYAMDEKYMIDEAKNYLVRKYGERIYW